MVGAMAIIGDLVPPRERGRYQGIMAGVMALAMIAGPLVGGFITDHLNWRWAFYVNLPLGGVALVLADRPAAPAEVPHRAPHRLARRRAALGRHHRARADHHLGRRASTPWGSWQIIGLAVRRRGRADRVRLRRAPGGRADPAAGAVPQPQLRAGLGDRLPARLRDVRRDQLPAALPADGAGRLGHQLRPAAAADDARR